MTTLARSIRNSVVVKRHQDPYHMDLRIVLQEDTTTASGQQHHQPYEKQATTDYDPYGGFTPTPSTMMKEAFSGRNKIPQSAHISKQEVVVERPSASDDDHNDQLEQTDEHLVVDILETNQDHGYLYHNAQYQTQNHTRRVVTPKQRQKEAPAAVETTTKAPSTTRERLDEAERYSRILESNVTLHKRLGQLEEQLHQRDSQLQLLQDQLARLQRSQQQQEQLCLSPPVRDEWDASVVTWKIPKFEKRLTTARHFFQSSAFQVSSYASFYLTVCVLEVDDTVPESRRPVAIFVKAAEQRGSGHAPAKPSIFPIRLDGSKITLVGNSDSCRHDKTVQVGETQMEDASQGKGVRQFTTLGTLRESFLQDDASVVVRATVRVPRIPNYRLRTV
jgi:hypothetical protein